MVTTTPDRPSAVELWDIIKKEITSIQLLWETVNGMYFQPKNGKGFQALETDAPLLTHFTQTALMESLLMRISRLMDPANSGKREGDRPNLSLKRLVTLASCTDSDEQAVRVIWDGSNLKNIRDKYLSHNDLVRLLEAKTNEESKERPSGESAKHRLNIPLESADIEALERLAEGLRALRRDVNHKLGGGSYLDKGLDLRVRREIETLGNVLVGGDLFFKLLPDHEHLQRAIESEGEKK